MQRKVFLIKGIFLAVLAILCCIAVFPVLALGKTGFVGKSSSSETDTAVYTAADGSEVVFSWEKIGESQRWDSRLFLPKCTVKKGSDEKVAKAILTYPNGDSSDKTSHLLNQAGNYLLSFATSFGEEQFRHDISIEVHCVVEDLFDTENAEVSAHSDPENLYERDGILVTSPRSPGRVIYRREINLADNTAEDILAEFAVLPSVQGEDDFSRLVFRLTDKYDPENFLVISAEHNKDLKGEQYSAFKAGSSTQVEGGLYEGGKDEVTRFDRRPYYGTQIAGGFNGENIAPNDTFQIFLDYETGCFYADSTVNPGGKTLVNNLKDAERYTENVRFKGFTTGEAILSVETNNQHKAYARYLLYNIDGQRFDGEQIADMQGPAVTVDFQGYAQSALPQGKVHVKYPVFTAMAQDSFQNTSCAVQSKVYYGYGTIDMEQCAVSEDGTFLPEKAGEYTIVYKASDADGNLTVREVVVSVLSEEDWTDARAEFQTEFPETIYLGEKLELGAYSVTGGSGMCKTEILIKEPDSEEEYALTEGMFVPAKQGNYSLIVRMEDFLGISYEQTIHIRAVSYGAPIFLQEPSVPTILQQGAPYRFADFDAVFFDLGTAESRQVQKSIQVTYRGETQVLKEDRMYTPQVETSGERITVEYIAEYYGQRSVKRFEVTVLSPYDENGILQMGQMFSQEYIQQCQVTKDGIFFTYSVSGASVSFANPLLADGFSLKFAVPEGKANFDSIKLTLFDSADFSEAVDLYFKKSSGNEVLFGINGKDYVKMSSATFGSGKDIAIQYDNVSKSILDVTNLTTLGKVSETNANQPFGGFSSGMIFFRMEFTGVQGESCVKIGQIANHTVSDIELDFIQPVLRASLGRNSYRLGDEVVIPKAFACDVIDGTNVKVELTVLLNGKSIVSAMGMTEDYRFRPTESGQYTVIYAAKDSSGNEASSQFVLSVRNTQDPVFTVNGSVAEKAKAQETINLPGVTVSNMQSGQYHVYVVVIYPDGALRIHEEISTASECKIQFEEAGEYIIRYYVEDLFCNYSTQDFVIVIE